MKKLIAFILLSASVVSAQPCFNGANGNCPGEMPPNPTFINPPKPITSFNPAPPILLFDSHYETERHYYHCAEGVALWGGMINDIEPSFVSVLPRNYVELRINQDCTGKIQIYPTDENSPELGVCSLFEDQEAAQIDYDLCRTTNKQYWEKLQKLQAQTKEVCLNPKPVKDGANKGNLYKPDADPNARCTFISGGKKQAGITILLDSKYQDTNKMEILDINGKSTGVSYFGFYQNSRPRFCAYVHKSKFGSNPIFLSFTSSAQGQCLKVSNASQRED